MMGIRSSRCQRPSILKSPARSCNRTLVATSSSDVSDERRSHRRALFDILERLVVAPMVSEPTSITRNAFEEPAIN